MLLYSSYSTCSSTPLAWLITFLLFNLFCLFCLTYFALFTQPVLLLLLDLLFCSSCSNSLFKYLSTTPMILLFFALLVLDRYFPSLFFFKCGVWRSYPNSRSSNQTWKVRIFVFNFCLLMSFFNYPFFWEIMVYNVFGFCARIIWTLYI
jgi:hypothetical protein